MDESDVQELGLLRARAYGRRADIDEPGMRRLQELEARARDAQAGSGRAPEPAAEAVLAAEAGPLPTAAPTRPPTRPASPASPPTAPASVTPGHGAAPAAPVAAAPEAAPAAPARRRPLVFLAAAVVVVVLIAVTVATALDRPGRVQTLAAAPQTEWPDQFGPPQEGATVFEEFHGLTLLLIPNAWGLDTAMPCLFVARPEPQGMMLSTGCGAEEFPPTAALRVTETMPQELRDRYPIGAELQFVLVDGSVIVYAAAG